MLVENYATYQRGVEKREAKVRSEMALWESNRNSRTGCDTSASKGVDEDGVRMVDESTILNVGSNGLDGVTKDINTNSTIPPEPSTTTGAAASGNAIVKSTANGVIPATTGSKMVVDKADNHPPPNVAVKGWRLRDNAIRKSVVRKFHNTSQRIYLTI